MWYGVEYKTTGKKKDSVEKLLEKAKARFLDFLTNPKKNRNGMEADLDNIQVEKRPYTRKSDGRKSHLYIAKIPVKINGKKETREYIFNKGFFKRI